MSRIPVCTRFGKNLLFFTGPGSELERISDKRQGQIAFGNGVRHVLDRQQRVLVQQGADGAERNELHQLVAHARPFAAAVRQKVLGFLQSALRVYEPLRAEVFRIVPQLRAHMQVVVVQKHHRAFLNSHACNTILTNEKLETETNFGNPAVRVIGVQRHGAMGSDRFWGVSGCVLTVHGSFSVCHMRNDGRGDQPEGLEYHGLGVGHLETVGKPDGSGGPDHCVSFLLYTSLHVRPIYQKSQRFDDEIRDSRMSTDDVLQREKPYFQVESVVPIGLHGSIH